MKDVEIRTIWHTAREQCEVVWSQLAGCRIRLWVEGRLIVDDGMADIESAIDRGWELRLEWLRLVE